MGKKPENTHPLKELYTNTYTYIYIYHMYMKRKQLATLSFRFLSLTFSTQFVIKPFLILKIMFLKFQYIKIVQLTRFIKETLNCHKSSCYH